MALFKIFRGRGEWQGFLLVLASAVGFGLMPIFARVAYAGGASVTGLLFLRFTLGAAALWLTLALRRDLPHLGRRDLLVLLLMGALGYAGQSTLYFSSLLRIPASLTAMLLYLYPLLVSILGWALFGQALGRSQVAALALSLGGLALVLGRPAAGLRYDLLGVAMGAGAGLVYSLYILVGDRVLNRVSAQHATAVVITAAAVVFFTSGLAAGNLTLRLTPAGWVGVLGVILFGTLVAILGFFAGMQRLGPSRASILSTIEPVVTVAAAWAFLGESLDLRQLAGAFLVLAGALLVRMPARAQEKAPRPRAPGLRLPSHQSESGRHGD